MRRAFSLLAALAILASCNIEELQYADKVGKQVRFTANTYYENGPSTRTSYSGEFFGTTPKYERIDWVDTDLLHIWAQAGNDTAEGDCEVTSHATDSDNGQISTAQVEGYGTPIVWLSTEAHTFYALYPSPATDEVDETKVTLNANVITATIPATQVVTAAPGSKTFKPDMNFAYMWAATTASPGSDVPLGFKPLMTAFEFTVGTPEADGIQISSFVLSTDDESPSLAGDFTATVSDDLASCPVTSVANGSPSITVDLGDVTATNASPVSFTVFALPQELKNLTMQFNLTNGLVKKLALKQRASETDPYEFVTFAAGKKYRITNIAVPGTDGWTYTLEEVEPDTPMALNQAAAGTATKGMKSYRTKDGVNEEVSMKFRYSPAGSDGTCANDWSTDLPAWLESLVAGVHTGEQLPDDPFTLTGTYTAIDADSEEIVNEILEHIALLKQNGTNGKTKDAPQDLALYDIDNLTSPRSAGAKTANSYVVDRAGWYMFPLVYGNAIDFERGDANGWNVGAYYDGQGEGWDSGNYNVLHRFRNYLNTGIQSPYVLDDVNLAPSAVEAVIVWEDASEENLFIKAGSVELVEMSSSAYKASDGGTLSSVPFIRFQVDPDGIRQGNAVIAVREKAGDQRIIWSWHVWVTDTDLTTLTVETRASVNPAVASNQMLKVNLGWCDTKIVTEYSYAPRKYFVEVSQVDGDGNPIGNATPVVFAVTQSDDPYRITFIGAAPFYQYGRKDPLLPDKGELMNPVNKDSYSPAGYPLVTNDKTLQHVSVAGSSDGNVSYGIQNPHIMYGRGERNGWVASEQRNLWDMTETATLSHSYQSGAPNSGKDKIVIKTIYDPCPPGFSVPNYTAFTIFTKTGGNVGTADYSGWATEDPETEDGLGFLLNTTEAGGEKILFPWQGFRSEGRVYAGPFYLLNSKSAGDRYSVNFNLGGTMRDVTKSNAYNVRPVKEIQ